MGVCITELADIGRFKVVTCQDEDPNMAECVGGTKAAVDAILTLGVVNSELDCGREVGTCPNFTGFG